MEREEQSAEDYYARMVDGVRAKVIILSRQSTADDLAATIGLAPDEEWDRHVPAMPDARPYGHAGWYSGVKYLSRLPYTASGMDHVADLCSRLEPFSARIRALARKIETEEDVPYPVRLWIDHETTGNSAGFEISPALIEQLASMGAWLAVATYFRSEEWADHIRSRK